MIRFLLIFFLVGCGGKKDLVFDRSISAEQGRDLSLIFKGCGSDFERSYLFCDLQEFTIPLAEVSIFLPRVDCSRRSCVELRILRPDGSFGYSISISRGNYHVGIPIQDVIGETYNIKRIHDGEYRVLAQVFFDDKEGIERSVRLEGLIRVWIRASKYQKMGCHSPHYAWQTDLSSKCEAQFSTSGRSALCGVC